MDADEVVIHEIERQCVAVIVDLFRKCVCQPREAAHSHAHVQVLALNIGSAEKLVGVTWIALLALPYESHRLQRFG
jgi:hypothetical protein